MEHALSTTFITLALITISAMAFGKAYMRALQVQDATAVALRDKALEVGAAIESAAAGLKGMVYGISTGKQVMESVELDPFSIIVKMPGGLKEIGARKVGISMGTQLSNSPGRNFTFGQPSARPFNSFIIPVLGISRVETDVLMNSKIHHLEVRVPLISSFRASGSFDLAFSPTGKLFELHEMEVKEEGTIELYLDGDKALEMSVGRGDLLRIVLEYLCIEVERR